MTTVVAHIERCPCCNKRVFIRAKGTFATHYGKGAPSRNLTAAHQCPASRRTPAEARGETLND